MRFFLSRRGSRCCELFLAVTAGGRGVRGDFEPVEADFTCSRTWTRVGHIRITNRCGMLDEAVRVATDERSSEVYPVGTLITLDDG